MNLLCMRRQTGLPLASIGVAGAALAIARRHRTHLTPLQRASRRH